MCHSLLCIILESMIPCTALLRIPCTMDPACYYDKDTICISVDTKHLKGPKLDGVTPEGLTELTKTLFLGTPSPDPLAPALVLQIHAVFPAQSHIHQMRQPNSAHG